MWLIIYSILAFILLVPLYIFIKIGYVPLLEVDLTNKQKAKLFLLAPLILILSPMFVVLGLVITMLIYVFMLPEWIKLAMCDDEQEIQNEEQ